MLLWMWDESNTALLAMIGSGLVPTADADLNSRRDRAEFHENLPSISAS